LKVFISWSGDQSRDIGKALEEWLPSVLQYVQVYYSPSGIEKGASWFQSISTELKETVVCIAVLNNENFKSEWVSFEAGAISKGIEKSRACPLLIGMSPTDLSGPLGAFQATVFDKTEVKKLMASINQQGGDRRLAEKTLDLVFDKWWPDIETKVAEIGKAKSIPKPVPEKRSPDDVLEEVSILMRQMALRDERGHLGPMRRNEMPVLDLRETLGAIARGLSGTSEGATYEALLENSIRPIKYLAEGIPSKRLHEQIEELSKAISNMNEFSF
jgi:TIR domain